MNRYVKRTLITLVSVPLFIFTFVTIALIIVHQAKGVEFSYENNGTDLTFCSSDGIWKAEEDMINGKSFEKVLLDFELYRLRCDKPEVHLLRTKEKKKPWKWAWWFDNYNSPKWRVPYIPKDEITVKDVKPCPSREYSSSEIKSAQEQVKTTLTRLRLNKY